MRANHAADAAGASTHGKCRLARQAREQVGDGDDPWMRSVQVQAQDTRRLTHACTGCATAPLSLQYDTQLLKRAGDQVVLAAELGTAQRQRLTKQLFRARQITARLQRSAEMGKDGTAPRMFGWEDVQRCT